MASSSSSLQGELDAFVKDFEPQSTKPVPAHLASIIDDMAKTGNCTYEWDSVRKLILIQLHNIITLFIDKTKPCPAVDGESFDVRYGKMLKHIQSWKQAPFTLQRMSELLQNPTRFYRNTSKFFQAFSKLVFGISADSSLVSQFGGTELPEDTLMDTTDASPGGSTALNGDSGAFSIATTVPSALSNSSGGGSGGSSGTSSSELSKDRVKAAQSIFSTGPFAFAFQSSGTAVSASTAASNGTSADHASAPTSSAMEVDEIS